MSSSTQSKARKSFESAQKAIKGIEYRQRTGKLTGRNAEATHGTLAARREALVEAYKQLLEASEDTERDMTLVGQLAPAQFATMVQEAGVEVGAAITGTITAGHGGEDITRAIEAAAATEQQGPSQADIDTAVAQLNAELADPQVQAGLAQALGVEAAEVIIGGAADAPAALAAEQAAPQPQGVDAYIAKASATKVRVQGTEAMRLHRTGYDAYQLARAAGDKAAQDALRPAYTGYKRAYKAWLAEQKAPRPADEVDGATQVAGSLVQLDAPAAQ